jgi:hypothetical protein
MDVSAPQVAMVVGDTTPPLERATIVLRK